MNGESDVPIFAAPSFTSVIWELREICGECVSVQEEDVIRINGSDGRASAIIEAEQVCLLGMRICRLVQNIIASNPCIRGVVVCNFGPKPDEAILKILVFPEIGDMSTGITMPSAALTEEVFC